MMRIIALVCIALLFCGCMSEPPAKPQKTAIESLEKAAPPSTVKKIKDPVKSMLEKAKKGTTSTSTTTMTSPQTTTTEAPAPAKPSMTVHECVARAGYEPRSFIFAYRDKCGSKHVSAAESVSRKVGLLMTRLDVGIVKEGEAELLECFYKDPKQIRRCNRLLCPATGEVQDMLPGSPAKDQVREFAITCKSAIDY